jgi:hypothetical protein
MVVSKQDYRQFVRHKGAKQQETQHSDHRFGVGEACRGLHLQGVEQCRVFNDNDDFGREGFG